MPYVKDGTAVAATSEEDTKKYAAVKELAEKEAGTGKTSEFLLEGAGYLFRYLEIGIHFI